MTKLLSESYVRMIKEKIFWVCIAGMFCFGLFITARIDEKIKFDQMVFAFVIMIGIVLAVFCSLFIGTEYSTGTIRNKLIVGHKRSAVFSSNLIVCISAGLVFTVSYLIPIFLFATRKHGWFQIEASTNLQMALLSILIIVTYATIFTAIAMLITSKAVSELVCMAVAFVLLFGAMYLKLWLGAPEKMTRYSVDAVTKEENQVLVDNPAYLSGTKREVCELALDLNPAGQCVRQFFGMDIHTGRCMVCSIIVTGIAMGAGITALKKKNIK